jgi:hypothetical protein
LEEIEDEARLIEYSDTKKVCHGRRQTNIIPGGPKPPNYSGMSSAELAEAKKEYKREWKRYTDGLRMKRLQAQNESFNPDAFTGCLFPTLQPMTEVMSFWLDVNQTFPDNDILTMRVAEEANLRGIDFVCSQSNVRDFKCTGYWFCVIAHQSERKGWIVNIACVCDGNEQYVGLDDTPTKLPPENPTSCLSFFPLSWIRPPH